MNKHIAIIIFQLFVLFFVFLSLGNVLYRIYQVNQAFTSGSDTCQEFLFRDDVEKIVVSEDVTCPFDFVNSFSFYNEEYRPVICCVKVK